MNVEISLEILKRLSLLGVEEVCICPGGRNAPFVKTLPLFSNLNAYSFYDERVAAFFALGLIKQSNKPVAVITTSGTAVANLLPATIEAYYSQLPLILITADRPQNYRGSASPQTIEQVGIFTHYAETLCDISNVDEINFDIKQKPIHINVCFDEPLLSDWKKYSSQKFHLKNEKDENKEGFGQSLLDESEKNRLKDFFEQAKSTLVLLGPDRFDQDIKNILLEWQLPIYAEACSNLREQKELQPLLLKSGEWFLNSNEVLDSFDSVIRIGQIPTVRLWRDLENRLKHWSVLSFSDHPFSGLSRVKLPPLKLCHLSKVKNFLNAEPNQLKNHKIFSSDKVFLNNLNSKLEMYPLSEQSWVRAISEWIPSNSQVFLGNSLPIREWDLTATFQEKNLNFQCNRGANGIDGLIATAMGWTKKNKTTFCILGDLSALYDMNALQSIIYAKGPLHVIVINNGGGRIFSPLFNDKNFENRHELNFKNLAEMFHFKYYLINQPDFSKVELSKVSLIEVAPNNQQTAEVYLD
ncbi:MAG: 2-succinyl-5-enolpyruvyl-6-hydroxy-3-cyclohexene-1-carboxylic-acid synthase [Bdellovibrionales bacterium]|nr:2-succinyl-5-enolpyruvyl-6-hydroxy-3-cyclohexene-1-carboxylic-acid synthase [Bdellovibrionales bacterium]